METDPQKWLDALRASHDRLRTLADQLDSERLRQPSYAADWSMAQVLSHLGSQAEIFDKFLDSVLAGSDPPGSELFGPIWQRWDGKTPEDQASEAVAANTAFVARVESMDDGDRGRVRLSFFGRDLDLAGLLQMRLSEHALHTWDIAVAIDDKAQVSPDAVDLIIDTLNPLVQRTGRSFGGPAVVELRTTEPDRRFRLEGDADKLTLADGGGPDPASAVLTLPAEALIRLVYGRLDPAHTPAVHAEGVELDDLRKAFPGF